jgi:salicylate hydroxylase
VLTFADGTCAEADVVVGADGVHSTVRGAVTGPSPPRNSGMCAFRAIVPAGRAPAFARRHAQTLWIGPGHHLVHYPISGGAAVNVVAIGPAGDAVVESWSATATVGELLAGFAGWDQRLQDLIRQAGTPGRWALLDREPLGRWSRGPVTLLGDAAHPMFPFFAQGACRRSATGGLTSTTCRTGPSSRPGTSRWPPRTRSPQARGSTRTTP